jgi:hypothetical protein
MTRNGSGMSFAHISRRSGSRQLLVYFDVGATDM